MTDAKVEKKAEESLEKRKGEYWCIKTVNTYTPYTEGYKDGYEQGKKDYITNDRSYVIPTKEMSYVEIAKENEELKEQLKNNPYVQLLQNEKAEMLEDFVKQIEKMKTCGNCRHYKQPNNYLVGTCKGRWNVEGNNICNEWELAE